MSASLLSLDRLLQSASRGALYGLFAGVLLGIGDLLGTLPGLRGQLEDGFSFWPFVLRLALLPLGPAVLCGVLGTVLVSLLARLADRQAEGRAGRSEIWLARYLSWAALPGLIWLSLQVFAGPRAQKLPGRPLLQGLLVVVGWLSLRGLLRFLAQRRGTRQPGLALLALVLAAACLAGDRVILPRLYPWFHQSLQLVALLCALWGPAALLPASVWSALPAVPATRDRRWLRDRRLRALGWLLLPLLLLPIAMQRSLAALGRLHRASVLRSHVLEHSTIGATLLRPYAALRTAEKQRRKRARPLSPLPEDLATADPDAAQIVPPSPSGPRLSGRDVFLITVDALRHDRLHLMPTVQALAARGVTFSRAYTQVPHTSFALATLLTGKPVYALLTLGQDAASHETLPLILRRFRYKTAAFYPPSVFYIEHDRLKSLEDSAYGFEYVKYEYLDGQRRTDQVLTFLETEKPERAFVWVHYLEPHEPYERHPDLTLPPDGRPLPEAASDSQRYDGEIAYVDREIARLIAYLRDRRPGAVVILAADHGEEFSEHGGRYHGTTLYEELVHIPLILSTVPAADPAGAGRDAGTAPTALTPLRYSTPVGLLDVAPTLLGLLDIERSARMRGRDLSPWILSASPSLPIAPVFAEIGRKKMVVLGDDKLICDLSTDACQLFQLGPDPGEQRNVLGLRADVAARLRAALNRSLAEAQRYEAAADDAHAGSPPASATPGTVALDPQLVARAQLGDRAVLPDLLAALPRVGADAAARRSLLGVLGPLLATRLPDRDAAADPLAGVASEQALSSLRQAQEQATAAGDPVAARWAAVSRLRLAAAIAGPSAARGDDAQAALPLVQALLSDAQAASDQRLCAALALAALPSCRAERGASGQAASTRAPDCVALWLDSEVLPAALALQDADRVRPLIERLGQSQDPRVLASLLAQLDNVLSRADLVRALGELGQAGAVPALRERLLHDPYVHVRVAAAAALGTLQARSDRARPALLAAAKSESEAAVRAAIAAALGRPASGRP